MQFFNPLSVILKGCQAKILILKYEEIMKNAPMVAATLSR